MYTPFTANIIGGASYVAGFRSFLTAIFNALASQGLVQTSDTGQLDPAAATWPALNYTSAGYTIWRFNDSLAATKPVYIKLEFGRGSTDSSYCAWATVGTGSDGAGNITGELLPRSASGSGYNINGLNSPRTCFVSGHAGRMTICLAVESTGTGFPWAFNVERSKNALGQDTSDGLLVQAGTGSSAATSHQRWFQFGALSHYPSTKLLVPLDTPSTMSSGNLIGVCPIFPLSYGGLKQPGLGILAYSIPDITQSVLLNVDIYGAAHQYMPMGAGFNYATLAGNNVSLLVLAE